MNHSITYIGRTKMSKAFDERRKVRQGDFEYLVDDDDRTAWINEGNSGGARIYTLPEKVVIETY